jgi:hypothetical protein
MEYRWRGKRGGWWRIKCVFLAGWFVGWKVRLENQYKGFSRK